MSTKYRINKNPCNKLTKRCYYPYSDINTPSPICWKNNLVELLSYLVDILNKHNIKYFIDYGTLLGCVRNNKFIPWDTDIDISIIKEDKFNNIIEIINKDHYLIITHPQLYVLNYSKNNLLHVDISIRIKDYDNIYIDKYYKNMYGIHMDDLFPLQDNIFENIKIKIPYNSKKYLENIYGKKCIENPRRQLCNECFLKSVEHIKYTKCP